MAPPAGRRGSASPTRVAWRLAEAPAAAAVAPRPADALPHRRRRRFSSKHAGVEHHQVLHGVERDHVGIVAGLPPQRCFLLEWRRSSSATSSSGSRSTATSRTIAGARSGARRARTASRSRIGWRRSSTGCSTTRRATTTRRCHRRCPAVRHQLNVLAPCVRHARHEVVEDLSALFCSKTVAVCWQGRRPAPQHATPPTSCRSTGRPTSTTCSSSCGGAVLAPEVVLTFESELQRGLLLRFLALADLGASSATARRRLQRRRAALRPPRGRSAPFGAVRRPARRHLLPRPAPRRRRGWRRQEALGAPRDPPAALRRAHELRAHHEHHNPLAQEHVEARGAASARDDEEVHV